MRIGVIAESKHQLRACMEEINKTDTVVSTKHLSWISEDGSEYIGILNNVSCLGRRLDQVIFIGNWEDFAPTTMYLNILMPMLSNSHLPEEWKNELLIQYLRL